MIDKLKSINKNQNGEVSLYPLYIMSIIAIMSIIISIFFIPDDASLKITMTFVSIGIGIIILPTCLSILLLFQIIPFISNILERKTIKYLTECYPVSKEDLSKPILKKYINILLKNRNIDMKDASISLFSPMSYEQTKYEIETLDAIIKDLPKSTINPKHINYINELILMKIGYYNSQEKEEINSYD